MYKFIPSRFNGVPIKDPCSILQRVRVPLWSMLFLITNSTLTSDRMNDYSC